MKTAWLAGITAAVVVLLTACGGTQNSGGSQGSPGGVGDTMSTAWFDYTVTGADLTERYQDIQAETGERLLVLELEIDSTCYQEVPMTRYDFQLYWEGMGDGDDRCYPLEAESEDQLPDRYDLGWGEKRTGSLAYRVPQEQREFTLVFQELIDNGTEEGLPGGMYATELSLEG